MPRNECRTCLVEGACIFMIASTFLGSGFTPCGVYISPVLNQPLGFLPISSTLTQDGGPITGMIVACSTISSSSLSNLGCSAKGMFLVVSITG